MSDDASRLKGQVVLLAGGLIGSVKYVGPLGGESEETFLGIRLGEGTGDCSGYFREVKYFSCPENKGVFVKPSEVKKIINPEGLLTQVVKLNKAQKQLKAEISELKDKLTLSEETMKDFEMKSAPAQSTGSDDNDSIQKFLEGELNKKWYIGCEDLQQRYKERDSNEVASIYNRAKSSFDKLAESPAHTRIVYTVCSSKVDNMIASGSDDKTIRLWRRKDPAQASCIAVLQLRSCINSLAFSPTGNLLAAALDSGWIELYDLGTGKMVGALEGQTTSEVWTICFSPDGNNIISGALDRAVRIWDVKERECRWALRGHDEWVNGVAVAGDGKTIVSGSGDKTVRLWDTNRMTCRNTLRGHTDFVRSVCVNEDSTKVVSASDDTQLRVWDIQKGTQERVLAGHTKGIYSVSAGARNTIASASRDSTVRIWDLNEQRQKQEFKGHRGDVNSCAFLAGGRYVASGSDDKTVQIFSVGN